MSCQAWGLSGSGSHADCVCDSVCIMSSWAARGTQIQTKVRRWTLPHPGSSSTESLGESETERH